MADDKELKYLMCYKPNKISETQTSQLSSLNICSRLDETADITEKQHSLNNVIGRSIEYKNHSCVNDTSIVLHRKKKYHYKNLQATIGLLDTTKKHKRLITQYSSPLLYYQNNSNIIIIYNKKDNKYSTYHEKLRQSRFPPSTFKSYNNLQASIHLFSKLLHTSCEVYRCQFSTQEESCCCSCNSDAMFEVMKSLYDCYKKKNCDHCNCILCGHLPREERRLGELRKSGVDLSTAAIEKTKKKKKVTSKEALAMIEAKTPAEKEKTLKELAKAGVPLPEPRTKSEEILMTKVKTELGLPLEPLTKILPSEKLRKAKELGLLTPLEGKSVDQKEKILRGLVMNGIPLPKGKTDSERKLMDKVRTDMGMPPEPKTMSEKKRYKRAMDAGLIITPLEGKTRPEKERILKQHAEMGIPLPQGRTASEKSLIAKILQTVRPPSEYKVPSEKIKKAKAEGILTPLRGKTPAQKEKILKGLAINGLPLPSAKTESDQNVINKVRKDLGLPPEPKKSSDKNNYKKALAAGIITPLEGKSASQKEEILKKQAAMGISLPEGRTSSEKALISKIQQAIPEPSEIKLPSEKMKKAKAAGLLTPLEGKTPAQKEKVLRDLVMSGIPIPPATTTSDRNLIDKVRNNLGLPPEPRTSSEKKIYKKALAAGLITPLEGKTVPQKEEILKKQAAIGIPLPRGRTPSEKAILAKIQQTVRPPSTKMKKSDREIAELLTKLEGKPEKEKQEILNAFAIQGKPLPEGRTTSEKKIIEKVRQDLGLPPEPKSQEDKEKYKQAVAAGVLVPLTGKSVAQKEKILQAQADMGLELPEGRTSSEKALIKKIKARKSKRAKSLPPENIRKLDTKTAKVMKESKGPSDECICDILTPASEKVSRLGVVPQKATSEKLRKAKAAGLLTPLEGKSSKEKEKILKGLAKEGLPLPEPKTTSQKQLIEKIKAEMSVPSAVKGIPSEKIRKAKAAGLLTPLHGKTETEKEKILRGLAQHGISLPQAQTASEKKLIDKVRKDLGLPPEPKTPTLKEKYRHAQEAGFITPLEGKSQPQKEKILAKQVEIGIPLPEGRTQSEKDLINRIRASVPKKAASEKLRKAKAAGLLTPLEGKTLKEKEKILKSLAKEGLPLPEPKSASEKQLIAKVKSEMGVPMEKISSEKLRKARAAGLITPLGGKSQAQKEKILKGRIAAGMPLPEGVTTSDKELIKKVIAETGYVAPPLDKRRAITERGVGTLRPTSLKGKTQSEKEAILMDLAKKGIPLPEPKTASDKAVINKIIADLGKSKVLLATPEKLKAAKAAGLLTPLKGKTDAQKEKILKGMALHGIPLPKERTPSEKKIFDKVRKELGLPPEPKTPALQDKYRLAQDAGIITPLEGKSATQKQKILAKQAEIGILLPEGRSQSEKDLINRIRQSVPKKISSEKLRKAKKAGLLTPLQGKSSKEKEKILKGLAKAGLPLPEAKTASERQLIKKVKADMGLPVEEIASEKLRKAMAQGLITPLEGKSQAEKERILKGRATVGLPLPEGVTPSDKEMIKRIKADIGYVSPRVEKKKRGPSDRVSKVASMPRGLGITPAQREKNLKDFAIQGKQLPEAKTGSEIIILDKVRRDLGLPPEPKSQADKAKYKQAVAAGVIVPLEGKSVAQREKILQAQADMGLELPEGRTASEKALIKKIKAEKSKRAKLLPPEKIRKLDIKTAKVMKEGKGPSDECICEILTPDSEKVSRLGKAAPQKGTSEKIRKAKAGDLLTSLEGKSSKEKEIILKGLAKEGLPLPEPKTTSEKKLIEKIKTEMGVPSAVKGIPSEKMRKAKAAGLLTPLQGKPEAEKEKILRGLAQHGIPLPQAQTASEKKVIDKVRKEVGLPPEPKTSSLKEKYRQAQEAGLMTPLENKSSAQKEKILKKQAEMGLPLPEGRTQSEKDLINRIRATVKKLPSEKKADAGRKTIKAKTSEKEVLKKAKAEGLLTPLKGKSPEQKEKILKGLAEAGLPMPEAKTASEKALIEKVRTALRLPLEPTLSEKKGKIKSKSRKTSVAFARKSSMGVGVGKSKMGVKEEFKDVIKTTTCDRGCGCDRKKIRFKHSYVKIRVTSPDISSLCPCPEECVPGVKGGVFTDNEGIKVTVGQVTRVPSFQSKEFKTIEKVNNEINRKIYKSAIPNYFISDTNILRNRQNTVYDKILDAGSLIKKSRESTLNYLKGSTPKCGSSMSDTFILIKSSSDLLSESELSIKLSLLLERQDSSLIFSTHSNLDILSNTISIISFSVTDCSSNSIYLIEKNSIDSSIQSEECTTQNLEYLQFGSISNHGINSDPSEYQYSSTFRSLNELQKHKCSQPVVFRLVHNINNYSPDMDEFVNTCKYVDNRQSIIDVVGKILSDPTLKDSSSLYVLLPTSSDDSSIYSMESQLSSTICIQLSETQTSWSSHYGPQTHYPSNDRHRKPRGLRIVARGRNNSTREKTIPSIIRNSFKEHSNKPDKKTCPEHLDIEEVQDLQRIIYEIGTDTTVDRPCSCKNDIILQVLDDSIHKTSNVISELVAPLIINEAVAQDFNQDNNGININSYNRTCSTRIKKMCNNQSPMRNCRIPPCSEYTECHPTGPYPYDQYSSTGYSHPRNNISPTNKQCECDFEKLKEMVEKIIVKKMVSTACGSSRDFMNIDINKPTIKKAKTREPPQVIKIDCSTCSKPNLVEPRERLCFCGGQKKKITIGKKCPCEEYAAQNKYNLHDEPDSTLEPMPESKSDFKLKKIKKSKNIICECPQEPPEDESEPILWIDERQLRKMKSDLTQTISGFKINKARKSPETEMSFEEALEYFETYQDEGTRGLKTDVCLCDDEKNKKHKKDANCECPYTELPPEKTLEGPFKGIKLHIGGKGSMSRGLSGVLCFELLEH